MRKIKSRYISSAFLVTAMLQGHPAYACADSLSNEGRQMDRIYSKYIQITREFKALMDAPNPQRISFCRLSREQAELEREFLDYRNIVKSSCPAVYNSLLNNSSAKEKIGLVEHNYELSQKMIGYCIQQGL